MFSKISLFCLLVATVVYSLPNNETSTNMDLMNSIQTFNFHPKCNVTVCRKTIVECLDDCTCIIPTPKCFQACMNCIQKANDVCCMCFHTCDNATKIDDY